MCCRVVFLFFPYDLAVTRLNACNKVVQLIDKGLRNRNCTVGREEENSPVTIEVQMGWMCFSVLFCSVLFFSFLHTEMFNYNHCALYKCTYCY